MSAATILFEDVDGQIACKVTFSGDDGGGFNAASHAHQHAQILLGFMDQLCTKAEVPAAPEPAMIVQG